VHRRIERALAGTLVALLLASALVGTIPAAALATTASTPASLSSSTAALQDSGMVTVPDANIQANIPQSAQDDISYNISEWRGSVMTSLGADSMQVTLTTRAAATGTSTSGDPQFALQLTDDQLPDSRTVAVPADALEQAIGYQPVVIQGYHEDGSRWTTPATRSGNLLYFDVPHFSTNTVTFGGDITLSGSPATDGSSYQYEVQDVDAVQDFHINVTGSTSYDRENATGQIGNGGTLPLSIAGNSDPVGPNGASTPEIVLEGVEARNPASKSWTGLTGSSSTTVSVGGNQSPTNGSVTFEGSETTTSASTSATGVSDGATKSYSVGGNVAPEGPSAVNEPEATFTGRTQSTANDVTLSGVSTGSHAITTNGNIPPSGPSAGANPEVTITAPSSSEAATYNHYSQDDGDFHALGITGGSLIHSAVYYPNADVLGQITFNYASSSYCDTTGSVDYSVRVVPGNDTADSVTDGTEIKTITLSDTDLQGDVTVDLNNHDVSGGNGATVQFYATGHSMSGSYCRLETKRTFKSNAGAYSGSSVTSGDTDLNLQGGPDVVFTAGPGSATVSDGTDSVSVSFSSYGEAVTKEFDMGLSQSIDVSGSPGGPVDVTIDKNDRTASEDPGLDWNDDGSVDASYSGILTEGQTATVEVAGLSTGSHTASASLSAGTVDWTLDWTEVTATEDPDLTIDGSLAASYNGVLRAGETATKSVTGLSLGSNSLSWGATTAGGGYEANLSWDEVTHTEDPSVDTDGDGTYEINHVGVIDPGTTKTYSADLSRLTDSLTIATNNGSEVLVEAQYRERTQTADPAIEVNGNTTDYPGQIPDGEKHQLTTDPAWVQDGTNRVNVSLGSGSLSADAPQLEVGLEYRHESVDNQSVTYTEQRWTSRYNVSRTWLSDQESAYLSIPVKSTVLQIRDVQKRVDGNAWGDLQPSDYELNGSRLRVQLGSISKNTKVAVRVNASRVRVTNGSIQVLDPTDKGFTLDTRFKIESWSDGGSIQLPARDRDLIAYAYNESWTAPSDSLRVTSDGTRTLRLPQAVTGGTTRVSTIPVAANPQTGDVVIQVGSPSSTEPKFVVKPGQLSGDTVDYTFVGANDGTKYLLYSQTEDIVKDSGTASSPLTLTDDDSAETLQFLVDDGSVTSDGGGGGGGGGFPSIAPVQEVKQGTPLGWAIVGVLSLLTLAGLYWLIKRRQRPVRGIPGEIADFLSTRVVLLGLGVLTVVAAINFHILDLPPQFLAVGGLVALVLGSAVALRRFGLWDLRIFAAVGFIVLVLGTQLLAPEFFVQLGGSETFQRFALLLGGLGLYLVYRAIKAYRASKTTVIQVTGDSS